MVIWLIGLAGAGKTSIGSALVSLLKPRAPATVLVDGDAVREIMGADLGYTLEDRRANGWRICRLCRYLERQGCDVVCATLSQFPEQQQWNRDNYQAYVEVFVDVAMAELERRDQKGLYSGARTGAIRDVVGVDMPFVPPRAPDLILDNNTLVTDFAPLAQRVWTTARNKYPRWEAARSEAGEP